MIFVKKLLVSFSVLWILCLSFSKGANFDVVNQCPYTVWAAALPGEGKRLESGQTWKVNVQPGRGTTHIWDRTSCTFDANERGKCDTGDCNGMLECQGYGSPPNTLAELALSQEEIIRDSVDISIVDGFNIPMEFSPVGAFCKTIRCVVDINGQCSKQLRTQGGCNNPCTVFKTVEYCCTIEHGSCGPTKYSKFFRGRCPDVYSYPQDVSTSLFTCPSGSNYKVVFYP